MKKSKFTLVIVLGLVLCLLCGTTTTFSWFNRPEVQKGDSLLERRIQCDKRKEYYCRYLCCFKR